MAIPRAPDQPLPHLNIDALPRRRHPGPDPDMARLAVTSMTLYVNPNTADLFSWARLWIEEGEINPCDQRMHHAGKLG